MIKNGLRIFYDDFSEKVKNIHDEMEKHHSYKKKRVLVISEDVNQHFLNIPKAPRGLAIRVSTSFSSVQSLVTQYYQGIIKLIHNGQITIFHR